MFNLFLFLGPSPDNFPSSNYCDIMKAEAVQNHAWQYWSPDRDLIASTTRYHTQLFPNSIIKASSKATYFWKSFFPNMVREWKQTLSSCTHPPEFIAGSTTFQKQQVIKSMANLILGSCFFFSPQWEQINHTISQIQIIFIFIVSCSVSLIKNHTAMG